ncbi:hypothetical protein [Spirosoma fluviale]|uniref:Uncharacterized protein n=1 Tax=Spirosoma fluviale TaxID=1597977 RepID=A0A286GJZ6_9BACT|nr:hypothetical protein [Spirosoma fluviale]SOD95848.1 hypothetical protein SAMN06269250_5012 [Spirosoma fluviale]
MFLSKDYSQFTLDELLVEEKKVKSQQIPFALLIGFVVGVAFMVGAAFVSAKHKWGFIVVIGLFALAMFISSKYSKNLKSIQEEISRKKTVR